MLVSVSVLVVLVVEGIVVLGAKPHFLPLSLGFGFL